MMAALRDTFDVLIRFETELWNSIDARLRADLDLPLARFEIMRVIGSNPGCRVFDIADELSITIGGTSKLVDRIEAAGHCRRRPNPGDRRSSIIEVTPGGRRLLAKATKVFENELQDRMGSAVPERALEHLHSTLTRLRAANAKADQGSPRA
jgi:MarR family transcriptional regulator, organic hydroperoxide resistance regulator